MISLWVPVLTTFKEKEVEKMKVNLFIRTLLIIIVILLALNIIVPLLSNPPTSYAANSIQYKVGCIGILFGLKTDNLEKLLNEYSKEGWEPISINITEVEKMGLLAHVVFKK
jgi:hypothetical protein